jgi:hypothetical protein
MKTSSLAAFSLLSVGMLAWAGTAQADSREATCLMKKDGEKMKGKSGPCTFGQRQGYITIDLKNGDLIDLRPGNGANQYKDQNGNKVKRTDSSADEQSFRWESGKHLVVSFRPEYGNSGNPYGGYNHSYSGGQNEYQRGYNDGMHGDYDMDKHNQAYKDGYAAGEAARRQSGHHKNGSGDLSHGDYGINRLDNGGFEVVWSKPFCIGRFNKHGEPQNYTDGCTDQQMSRSYKIAQQQK